MKRALQRSELMLTCASWQEATRVTDHLMSHGLVRAVEYLPAKVVGAVHEGLEEAHAVSLVMQAAADNLADIETAVAEVLGHPHAVLQFPDAQAAAGKA